MPGGFSAAAIKIAAAYFFSTGRAFLNRIFFPDRSATADASRHMRRYRLLLLLEGRVSF
jgi:hypothetical protein